MVNSPLAALRNELKSRYEGALTADPNTLVNIYQELAMANFVIMALLSHSPVTSWVNASCTVLMALLHRLGGGWSLNWRATASLTLIYAVITTETWVYGGLNSLFMVWYLVIPMPLMLTLGNRAMYTSFGVIGILAFTTYALQRSGWLSTLPSPGTQMAIPLVTMAMMMLTILSMPVVSYIVLQQILTRQRQRNAELRDTQRILLQQRQQQDEFVASVSHELRTPMNAIMGFLQAMDTERMVHTRNRDMFSAMNHSARHLLTVINDLLDFSQIQAGNLRITPRPMSLHQLLRDVATMFDAPLHERGIPLRLWMAKDLPDWIQGDADRITQVIINLLGNAAKFTREGHVILRAVCTQGQRVRIEVEDTGCGIDPKQMQAVFDRFSRLTESTRREYGGTGLGLSISQNLVRLMGGEIGVESVVNEGSTFWFELPAERVQARNEHPQASHPHPHQTPVQQATVLIVDDSPINRVVARQMIHKDLPEFTVLEASGGQEALDLLATQRVDLILMDVIMPEMDGIETTRRIRALGSKAPPVAGLTADITKSVHQACLDAGMQDILTKPYTRADLVALIQASLRARVKHEGDHAAHA